MSLNMGHSLSRKEITKYNPIKVKVLFLGAVYVGKTSLIRRLCNQEFKVEYRPTVHDVFTFTQESNGRHFQYQVTDFPGLHSFPPMKRIDIKQSDVFVLVYSIIDDTSLEELTSIKAELNDVKETSCSDLPIIIVGNKADNIKSNLNEFVEKELEKNRPCIVTSAKTGYNVPYLLQAIEQESEKLFPRKPKSFSFLGQW